MADETGRRIVRDVACVPCDGLHDDLGLAIEDETIVEVLGGRAGCAGHYGPGRDLPEPRTTVEGRPVSLEAGIERAIRLLAASKAPAVWGLTSVTVEAQRAAVRLAERLGAVVGVLGSHEGRHRAFERVGALGATLGEVTDRADLILAIGHARPSGIDRPGRFVRDGRFQIAIGPEADLDRDADLLLGHHPGRTVEVVQTLRALLMGRSVDPEAVERRTGVPLGRWSDLSARLASARYGAAFCDPTSAAEAEAVFLLVRDLNRATRFVVVPGGRGPINRAGAEAVLAWRTGAVGPVDLAGGRPRYVPGDGPAERASRGALDLALIVGEGGPGFDRVRRVEVVPTPWDATPGTGAEVRIEAAVIGVDEAGTIARPDGPMLPVRAPLAAGRPTVVAILEAIEAGVGRWRS